MDKQLRLGVILQYVQMGLSILISLVYTPLMLKILGNSEYGLYSLASSIISYLSLLSLGFGSSYIRYYSIKKKNNPEGIKNLNGLYLFVFVIIGVVALISGLILSSNVSIFFNETYSLHDKEIAKALMILLTINLSISFPMSLFSSYIISQEKFIFQKLLNMGKTVLSPALSIIALFAGYGSIGLVIATTFISLMVDIVNIFFCLSKLKMRISFKNLDFKLAKDIFIFSIFIAINQIIDQINWQTDKIIIGKMMSTVAVSVYAIGSLLNSYFIQFSTAISSVFTPRVNAIVQENAPDRDEKLSNLMIKVGRVQFFILSLVLSGFIFFGKYFISIWAKDGYAESYYVALLLMCPVLVPLIQNIGIEIQRAEYKHKFRSIVYLVMALLNVGISILLCNFFGLTGVAFGTTISLIVANGLIMNIYYKKAMHLNIGKFWLEILKILPSLLVPSIVGIVLMILGINSIWLFFVEVFGYTILYCVSIYFVGLNKAEKKYIKSIFVHRRK